MALDQEILHYRKSYANATDSELIHHTYAWVPHSAQHIAAQQLLAERKAKKEEERHKQIEERLDGLKKPHWTVQPNFWITTVSAVAAILAAWFAWLAVRPVAPPPQPAVVVSPPSSSPKPQPVPATPKP